MYFTIKKKKDFHPCQNGQYGSPVLSNGKWRNRIPETSHSQQINFGLPFGLMAITYQECLMWKPKWNTYI